MKRKSWFWLTFMILLMALLAILGTRYNVISIQRNGQELAEPILGTLGFLVLMAGVLLFFFRLVQEMRLNQLQSEFLAAVTHELKTPLATLELSSGLLRNSHDLSADDRDQLWNSHQDELRRLSQEVDLLLEAARWDARAVEMRRTEVQLQEWIGHQSPRWKTSLGAEGQIEVTGDPLNFGVLADLRVLNLITDNLVDNARKFATGVPRLKIVTQLQDRDWSISFRDEGWGFEAGDAKKIFRRFFRSKSLAPYTIPGSGLGLFLAKSAAARMRMKMSATSEGFGKGATFILQGRRKKPKAKGGVV